jgi:GMP synthase-like glutamine amidotransferase
VIYLVSIEHESWLGTPEYRNAHFTYLMDVKLKVEAMTGQPCLVQLYHDVTRQKLRDLGVEAILISGNASDWSCYDQEDLADLYDLIRTAEWPILGFCGGHQLIAMAHGSTIAPMRRLRPGEPDVTDLSAPGYLKEWGFMPVEVVAGDPILVGLGTAPVFMEVHYCEIKELAPGFQLLASSRDCTYQLLKRCDQPVYGAQFHPEAYSETPYDLRNPLISLVYPDGFPEACPDGRRLIANFFRIAGILD